MAVERYNLTFNTQMSNQPILFNLGRKYRLIVTLEKANLSENAGWVQVAFNGDDGRNPARHRRPEHHGRFRQPHRTRPGLLNTAERQKGRASRTGGAALRLVRLLQRGETRCQETTMYWLAVVGKPGGGWVARRAS